MPTALITGASVGIGRELARLFARDGYELILVARDREKLEEAAAECRELSRAPAHVIVKDLARPAAPQELYQALHNEKHDLDVLVNNAGFGLGGRFDQLDEGRQLDMIQLNVTSLVQLTRLFLPGLLARRSGGILNVASTAAFQPGPYMAIYYATKAFVLSFTEAIAEELRHSGVTITALCPGPTRTEFQKRAGLQLSSMFQSRILPILDAATVARIGYEGFKNKRRIVIPGLSNKLQVFSVRLGSRRLVASLASKVNRAKG